LVRRVAFTFGTLLLGTGVMLLALDGRTIGIGMPDVLDLTPYHLTFADEFDQLDVSAWGPHTRWIAHTPWNGDFGDAAFSNPAPEFPFTIENGVLRIEARKMPNGKWRSGLLSSTDPNGNGFTQQFGYFEMRAKLPSGPGLWPAFWLVANRDPDTSAEIDVMEHYGVAPDKFESVMHVWPKEGRGRQYQERLVHSIPAGSLYTDFHTFGATVESDTTTFYLDRQAIARTPTPPEHRRPMFILLDLAMGAGWPIDQTPNPSYMYVDYVRAYAK
jgi:beta-glucanase (GH16 family)